MYLIPTIADYFSVSPEMLLGEGEIERSEYPICREGKYDCRFLHGGTRCVILTDTHFTRDCPFYKSIRRNEE